MSWIEEGRWNCDCCGHTNLGRHKNCQQCGAALDVEKIYFVRVASPSNAVMNPNLIAQANAGRDWVCGYCGGRQRNDEGQCVNCAAGKTSGTRVDGSRVVVVDSPREETTVPTSHLTPHHTTAVAPSRRRPVDTEVTLEQMEIRPRSHGHQGGWIVAIIVGVCGLLILGYLLFHTREINVTVKSVAWQRTIEVLRKKVVVDEGFDEDRPSDAFDVEYVEERYHHDGEQYQCGQEQYTEKEVCKTPEPVCDDLDNGFRRCRQPPPVCDRVTKTRPKMCRDKVNEPYYRWKVWRWKHQRDVPVQGVSVDSVRWPSDSELKLGAGCTAGEEEKEGTRTQQYEVVFVDSKGETYTHHSGNLDEFQKLPVGSAHHGKYSLARGVMLDP